MDISNQIKTRREAMGLSQEQLAEKLYVSRQTISNWERDKTYPDVQSLLMLSVLFDTSIDTLVKGDVTVMEEAVERDRKRMGTRMLWLAVLMLALLVLAFALILSPAFAWMRGSLGASDIATAWRSSPAIGALVVATVLERIKRENDLVTYREILAFMNGEADIKRDPRALPRRGWPSKHRLAYDLLAFIAAAIIGARDRLCHVGVTELTSLLAGQASVDCLWLPRNYLWAPCDCPRLPRNVYGPLAIAYVVQPIQGAQTEGSHRQSSGRQCWTLA